VLKMSETGVLSRDIANKDSIAEKTATSISVLIVDDHYVIREGLRRMLSMEQDITVIDEASNGEEAVAKAIELSPDVITMDLKMPGMDGIAATRLIKEKAPQCEVLMLTLYAEDFVREAIEAGASGYLLKDSDGVQIAIAIRQVYQGLCPIAPSLTKEMVTEFARLSRNSQSVILTRRQKDVLRLIAEGVSGKEISNSLYISTSTVKREIRNILARLGVADRAQAVSEAIKRKLI
jgi:two-component system, NarL family, response regulator DegU